MTVIGAAPYVQIDYPDQYGPGFPGTLDNISPSHRDELIGYSTETVLFCGRAVVSYTVQDFSNEGPANRQPFTIGAILDTSIADELVGVVVRQYQGNQNFIDADDVKKAGFGATETVSILPFGTKQGIKVKQSSTIGAVTYGDPVYAIIDVANEFGLQLGEFTNQEDTTPAYTLLVPNAIWYRTKGISTAINDVNTIQLL